LRFHTFEGPQGGQFEKRPIIASKYRSSIIDTRTRGNLFRRSVIDVPFLKNRWKRSGHLKDNEVINTVFFLFIKECTLYFRIFEIYKVKQKAK